MDFFETFGIKIGDGNYKQEMIYGVALLYNTMNRYVADYLKQFDLSMAKFNVLLVIKHAGKDSGISQVDISKRLVVTPSNMTRLLDRIEKEELVTRGSQAGDRRVNIIKITKQGTELLEKVWPGYIQTIEALADRLPASDQKKLSPLLIKWFESMLDDTAFK